MRILDKYKMTTPEGRFNKIDNIINAVRGQMDVEWGVVVSGDSVHARGFV